MSASRAAVSADIVPDIGTPLAVGKVVSRVIRRLDDGFAVRFNELQNLDRLEQVILHNWNAEGVRRCAHPITMARGGPSWNLRRTTRI
jgi:hypothetical protein